MPIPSPPPPVHVVITTHIIIDHDLSKTSPHFPLSLNLKSRSAL